MVANLLFFLIVAIGGGLGSAWYMIERGSPLTTERSGPWVAWPAAGRSETDPYTRANVLRRGILPMSPAFAFSFEARVDSDGRKLHSACEYAIDSGDIDAAWWALSAFDDRGRLIDNPAQRFSYNAATTMRAPGGRFQIVLAREARPGNWLPIGGGGYIRIVLEVQEAKGVWLTPARPLPVIRRVACR